MTIDWLQFLGNVGMIYVPLLFALCIHEFAHAWMARRLGDRTAEMMGRLSISPGAHIDLVGTVIFPLSALLLQAMNPGMGAFLFGWAKPVPVNSRNLKNLKADMFWIALAGPLSNVLQALVATVVLGVVFAIGQDGDWTASVAKILFMYMGINLVLAAFNMIPLHPLDGGKVLARFLPYTANRWLEDNQQMLSMALLILVFSGALGWLLSPVRSVVLVLVGLAELMARGIAG